MPWIQSLGRQFRDKSPRRNVTSWAANNGQLLAVEFEQACRELAERAHDEVSLITPIDLPAPSSFGQWPSARNPLYGICWLAPIYPAPRGLACSKPEDRSMASASGLTVIDTLRPTLRWSAFPRDLDRRQLDPSILNRIGNVTYELKTWNAEGRERGRLVYERTGLVTSEHPMEESLAPASLYFWSVLARFAIDGRPMATR